ncbi:MAG TPA: DUF5916 domain-containing protein [Gemmatimonadaceae bacterium]|nr:DUF5916 domain-containing protein [Gemmatimonadaceae bacterium]
MHPAIAIALLVGVAVPLTSPLAAQTATSKEVPAPLPAGVRDAPPRPERSSAEARATATTATAVRAAAAPRLDGRTDDPAWAHAPVIDQFLEYEPNEGAESRFRTEARVTYDDKNLYVLVRMFDPSPDSLVSLLARRDERVPSEQLKIVIDSYHDRRTAYQFAVNPAGVKRDFYVYNDNVEDASWDAVWDVGTAIDSVGWVAEFSIPFSQLRFTNKPSHTFGLMIVRDVARTGARISWPLYRRNVQGYVSQSGQIGGIDGLSSQRRLEVVPYVVTKNVTEPRGDGFVHPQELSMGGDVKYGLSSNLTLDATINPDFGQVEADPAVLNLSAFEQFFQERRPFFLEGTGIFTFNVNCGDIDTDCTGLFYSRRVGRAPQLRDQFGDALSPTATTILGAAKVTGRLGTGTSVGLLEAVTQEERGPDGIIEPATNYLVGRLMQDLRGGSTSLGTMVTATNRRLDDLSAPYLRREAYTGGVDFRHRFRQNNYELSAYLAGSVVRGSADAIGQLQLDGVHRYQRPDDALDYDPTRTSLAGDAQRLTISKFGGGLTRFQTVYQRYAPGFEINDLGFLQRADEQMFRNWFALNFNRPGGFYNRANLNFNHVSTWTTSGMTTNFGLNVNSHVQLKNLMWLHLGVNANRLLPSYDDRTARGGPAVRISPNGNFWAGIEGDGRRSVTPSVWFGGGRSDGDRSSYWYVEPNVAIRAASQFRASVGVNYERSINDRQWYNNFGDVGSDTTHYTFAGLDQSTVSMTARVSYTFTPALTLQVYANPYVSNGTYSDLRELSDDPRAASYADRYRPYTAAGDPGGFNYLQFRSNTVLRWEYRPGSSIFLVWSQGRDRSESVSSDFDLRENSRELFAIHPDNTLLLKVSYWFNP